MTDLFLWQLSSWIDINILLQFVIAAIMFSVGLSLRLENFSYVAQNKRLLFIGLGFKIVLIPFLSFLLLSLTTLDPVWQFGILILLFCPGGTTSNLITYLVGGTTALTIFLTVTAGVLTIFSLPLLVNQAGLYYFDESTAISLPISITVGRILLLIVLPAAIGLLLNEKKSELANQLEQFIKPTSVVLLGAVYVAKIFFEPSGATGSSLNWEEVKILLPWLLLINIGGMLLTYWLSRRIGLNEKNSLTIGIEMGVQNAALAILIGDVFLKNADLSKPALLYAAFTFWTTLGFAYAKKWRSSK